MRLLDFLILIETVAAREIFGRHKGKITRPESAFSSTRKLNLGTKSFTGFKRPESLSRTTRAPATVKPQGLSLSINNKNLPGLKPLETSAIKPSVGNRFSMSGGPRKMTSFSQISPVASIGIEKSKFVNGGQRNPEVKVEGNLSKGPGFSFLPGLAGGAAPSGRPIETKKFTPSGGARTGTTKLDTNTPKRYGAFDSAGSAPSAYQPSASTSSRGPGGFGASFSSPPQPEPPVNNYGAAPQNNNFGAQTPYQPSFETRPFTPSGSSNSGFSQTPAAPSYNAPTYQQAPSFDARTGQSAYRTGFL